MIRKISSHYILVDEDRLIKNGIVIIEDKTIKDIIETNNSIKEISSMEFYSGLLVPSLLDFTISENLNDRKFILQSYKYGVRLIYDCHNLYKINHSLNLEEVKLDLNLDNFEGKFNSCADIYSKLKDYKYTSEENLLKILPKFYPKQYFISKEIETEGINLITGIDYNNWTPNENFRIRNLI
ncbi:MAG: hypothetical protein N4A49_09905 [Marinifilaceae bacterium]|nr:hypothetical protein [Marinifilaceae bacterium]